MVIKVVRIAIKILLVAVTILPASNYMFKGNNRNTGTRCEKFTIKTPE